MSAIPFDVFQSCLKSAHRRRLLVFVASAGETYVGEMARHLRVSKGLVKMLLFGRPPYYSEELSLVRLGLLRPIYRSDRPGYEITPLGRRKARSLAASMRRRAEKRRSV